MLRHLGLTDDRLPDDAEELAAAYRAMLTGRRLLILDIVPAATHVCAALPVDPNVTRNKVELLHPDLRVLGADPIEAHFGRRAPSHQYLR